MEISLGKRYINLYVLNLRSKRNIMVSLWDYYKINSFDYGRGINADFSVGNSDYEIYMEITCCKLNALIEKTKFKD